MNLIFSGEKSHLNCIKKWLYSSIIVVIKMGKTESSKMKGRAKLRTS